MMNNLLMDEATKQREKGQIWNADKWIHQNLEDPKWRLFYAWNDTPMDKEAHR